MLLSPEAVKFPGDERSENVPARGYFLEKDMFEILLVIFISGGGGSEVSVTAEKIGKYEALESCEQIAKGLRRTQELSWNTLKVTAQCVQVKEKK